MGLPPHPSVRQSTLYVSNPLPHPRPPNGDPGAGRGGGGVQHGRGHGQYPGHLLRRGFKPTSSGECLNIQVVSEMHSGDLAEAW